MCQQTHIVRTRSHWPRSLLGCTSTSAPQGCAASISARSWSRAGGFAAERGRRLCTMPLSTEGRRYLGVDLPAVCVHRRAKCFLSLHHPAVSSVKGLERLLGEIFQNSKRLISAFQEIAEKAVTFQTFSTVRSLFF